MAGLLVIVLEREEEEEEEAREASHHQRVMLKRVQAAQDNSVRSIVSGVGRAVTCQDRS